ncbi:hypothetical protein L7F22_024909 [Adiantum nelumboides]|nr:hypothetical protein [Adiantum nelumboides]
MPALLTVLKSEDATLYGYLTNYKVQFLFHFFADVLGELNVLNCNFQEEHPDIASIGGHIKAVMETFCLSFFGDVFVADTCYMEDFLKKVNAQMGMMIFKDNANVVHSHYLHLGPMYEGDVADPCETFDIVNTLMMFICKSYLQSVVHALWNRFSSDPPVFEASKYFSSKDYDSNLEKCDACTKEWLQVLCNHFGKESKPIIVEKELSCERGFSKMNKIKNKFRNQLSLGSLSLLMFVGLNTPKVEKLGEVLWSECFEAWKNMKDRRARSMMTT